MATPARSRSSRILPALAGALGAGAAALWLVVDDARALDRAIAAGGGAPADRGTLILIGTLAAGALAWAIAYLVWGPGGWRVRRAADASRRPLTYADLGPPPPRERPLPVDLDQPLSAYDPDALRPGVKRPT